VVRRLKSHLLDHGLGGVRIGEIVVDADPSYIHSPHARHLEPMATVWVGGARPDLLCSADFSSYSLVLGFEVKARASDWPQGLAQARRYRSGVHQAYLALPGSARDLEREAAGMAREGGVGLLVFERGAWHQVLPAADPHPLPWAVGATASALAGVPAARRLQLNHPLNYLVVPFLVASHPELAPGESLAAYWPDLSSEGTRRHALEGARSLGLLDRDGRLTMDGGTVADLMRAVGFDACNGPNKRRRLSEAAPSIGAIARSVLLRQPAVRLILEVLRSAPGGQLPVDELYRAAHHIDRTLAGALFLADPSTEAGGLLAGADFNPDPARAVR
jgi:hypothetical protein